MSEHRALVEHFFRHEFGRLVAVLARSLGVRRLAELYDTLDRIAPSPLHALNRAVAEAYLHGRQARLDRLAAVLPENVPARYPGWHVVIGELHFRVGRSSAAERAWRDALRLATARADREFLDRRLASCRVDGDESATH